MLPLCSENWTRGCSSRKATSKTREHVLRNRSRNSKGQLSGDLPILPTKFLFRLGNECRYFRSVADQEGSLGSKGDAIRFDLKRDCGLGEKEVLRRVAESQMFSNGAKHLET